MIITTKSIHSLNKGESTVLCVDDKEYKEVSLLNHVLYKIRYDGMRVIVTKRV